MSSNRGERSTDVGFGFRQASICTAVKKGMVGKDLVKKSRIKHYSSLFQHY